MKRTWVQINEDILELEKERIRDDEWVKKWNKLLDEGSKIAGCLKRDKYDTENNEKGSTEERQEETESHNAECLHGHLAGEEA